MGNKGLITSNTYAKMSLKGNRYYFFHFKQTKKRSNAVRVADINKQWNVHDEAVHHVV